LPLSRIRVLAVLALGAAVAALIADPGSARSAATQNWSPFVLVAGLLLIGLMADRDGLFATAGSMFAGRARSSALLYAGAVVVTSVVTALLNLDTSVAFLTPVFVYLARQRGGGEAPLLYGCLLLSNAASLLLPGSNLTNLIVLGHLHLSGHAFFVRMAPAWAAAIAVTAVVVAVAHRRALAQRVTSDVVRTQTRPWLALCAVAATIVLVVVLHNAALPVVGIGLALTALRLGQRRLHVGDALDVLGIETLVALFAIAVAAGTLGRDWSGPAQLLTHLDRWSTAYVAAAVALFVNNLPASSLLAARVPHHPFALLVGLNLGPNVFASGSLAWLIWLRAARTAGARPSVAHAARLGLVAAPLSIAVAVAALSLS
jgi:arsenical pump membrane protein